MRECGCEGGYECAYHEWFYREGWKIDAYTDLFDIRNEAIVDARNDDRLGVNDEGRV